MTKKSNVYTATGDKGTTSLVGGKRVSKCDIRIEAYGTVDELNSFIGLLDNLHNIPSETKIFLRVVQNKLFNIGGYLANDKQTKVDGLDTEDIERIESEIDRLDAELPPLRNFVLPGGTRISSMAHRNPPLRTRHCSTCRRSHNRPECDNLYQPFERLLLRFSKI